MLFCTREYLYFFLAVFAAYWLLPWRRGRVWLLLGASFYFYSRWNPWLACIVAVSSLADYGIARGLDSTARPRLRRALLLSSLGMNLGLLAYFKYANFFLDSLHQALQAAGMATSFPVLDVIVPIGISFYTFEAINYTVDVYCRRIPAERNLDHFMLFILFFPHLVAGPIVRAADFLPQIRRRKRWNWPRMHLGMQFLLLGLVKKMVIADQMALFADPVFADPSAFRSSAVWVAVLAYAAQIYCDFSGYSDLAIGSAHLLGYRLAQNFDMPYLSANIAEFWRRWHISLSTWLRDYLFIPMGGSRGGSWATARNLFLTMALGGLWHGASWTFVLWGCLHGLLLIVHRGFRAFCSARPALDAVLRAPAGKVVRVALTLLAVAGGWVLFRAASLTTTGAIFARMFIYETGKPSPLPRLSLWCLLGLLVVGHALGHDGWWRKWSARIPAPILSSAYAVALNAALLLAPDAGKTFIYFLF